MLRIQIASRIGPCPADSASDGLRQQDRLDHLTRIFAAPLAVTSHDCPIEPHLLTHNPLRTDLILAVSSFRSVRTPAGSAFGTICALRRDRISVAIIQSLVPSSSPSMAPCTGDAKRPARTAGRPLGESAAFRPGVHNSLRLLEGSGRDGLPKVSAVLRCGGLRRDGAGFAGTGTVKGRRLLGRRERGFPGVAVGVTERITPGIACRGTLGTTTTAVDCPPILMSSDGGATDCPPPGRHRQWRRDSPCSVVVW